MLRVTKLKKKKKKKRKEKNEIFSTGMTEWMDGSNGG